jgi:hypothetical protein
MLLLGLVWNSIYHKEHNTAEPQPKKEMTPRSTRSARRKAKHFFKIRCHLRCPIFVSFATFVVTKSTRQCQILHTEEFPVEKHHHKGHEDHEEKQFKHKERKVENQKKSKAFVYFALFVVNQKVPND